jgi:YesN/AraC family two-component response regulator
MDNQSTQGNVKVGGTLRLEEMQVERAKQMHDEWAEIGRQMRVRREAAEMSLRRLADLLEISAPYLGDMERGFRRYQNKYVTAALNHITANNQVQGRPAKNDSKQAD